MSTEVKAAETGRKREEKPDLDRLYKPVGIAAVSAATICRDKKKSRTARNNSRKE